MLKNTYSRASHLLLPWIKEQRVKINYGKSCALVGESLEKLEVLENCIEVKGPPYFKSSFACSSWPPSLEGARYRLVFLSRFPTPSVFDKHLSLVDI
jgi:hypothetical protein